MRIWLAFLLLIISSATFSSPITVYVQENAGVSSQIAFLEESFRKVNESIPLKFELKLVSEKNLENLIRNNSVELFFASSAFFRQTIPSYEAQAIAVAAKKNAREYDRTDGTLALTLLENKDIKTIEDLRNKKVKYLPRLGFFGLYGIFDSLDTSEPHNFFLKLEKSDSIQELFSSLKDKTADVVLIPACVLEKEAEHFETHGFKAINPVAQASLGCVHTSKLYPGPVLGYTSQVPESVLALLEEALFQGGNDNTDYIWRLPNNNSFVELDNLLRKLKIDALNIYKKNYWMNLWNKYWGWIVFFFALLGTLILHWTILNHLVQKRTSQLTRLLKEKEIFISRERENRERTETLQKIGIVGLMSSIFAHEIRQPLSGLQCWTHALRKLIEKDAPKEEKLRILQLLSQTVQSAEAKVEQIRNINKQKGPGEVEPLNLKVQVEKVLNEIKQSTDKVFNVKFLGQCPHDIQMNSSELELVLHNIMKNSIQAQKDSPTIYLEFEFSENLNGSGVKISDGGPRIDPNTFDSITKPFYTTKEDGMGLGLTIVKTILTKQGAVLSFGLTETGSLSVSILFPKKK